MWWRFKKYSIITRVINHTGLMPAEYISAIFSPDEQRGQSLPKQSRGCSRWLAVFTRVFCVLFWWQSFGTCIGKNGRVLLMFVEGIITLFISRGQIGEGIFFRWAMWRRRGHLNWDIFEGKVRNLFLKLSNVDLFPRISLIPPRLSEWSPNWKRWWIENSLMLMNRKNQVFSSTRRA